MSIPKIIHYCWFGNSQKSELIKTCIASWYKYLVGYEVIEWNENNSNIKDIPYVKQAYKNKKYAFVSDYVRLVALYEMGGIYMDTDVEVIKPLDKFLDGNLVLGFESNDRVATALIMSEVHNKIIGYWLNTYSSKKFETAYGLDMTTNVDGLTKVLINHGLVLNGKNQKLISGSVEVFHKSMFNPYSLGDTSLNIQENTYTVHWCNGSWVSGKTKIKHNFIKLIKKVVGTKNYNILRNLIKKVTWFGDY